MIRRHNTIFVTYWLQDDSIRQALLLPYFEYLQKIPDCILGYVGMDMVDTTLSCSLTDKLGSLASHDGFQMQTDRKSQCRGLLVAGTFGSALEGFVNKTSR